MVGKFDSVEILLVLFFVLNYEIFIAGSPTHLTNQVIDQTNPPRNIDNIGENQSVPFPVNLDANLQAQNYLHNPSQIPSQDQLIQSQNIAFANQVRLITFSLIKTIFLNPTV